MDGSIEEIIHTYGDYLLRVSYIYVKDQRVAEEIVQDVFFLYYHKEQQFRGQSSLKTYLVKMTRNRCIDYLRSWKNKKAILFDKIQRTEKMRATESEIIEKQERRLITEAVLRLKMKLREVILLYYYGDYTTREIAEILQVSESTVKSRLQKARVELKKELQGVEWEVLLNGNESI